MVDADPQASLSSFLGHEVEPNQPTLLEVLKGALAVEEAIYPIETVENLFLIPADDGLELSQEYLASTGVGASMLRNQLEPVERAFKFCVLDSPPQKSQLCRSVIGAAQQIIVLAEATAKGYGSLVRTLDAIEEMRRWKGTAAQLLGVIPFRDRWVGQRRTKDSSGAISAMQSLVGDKLLPSIRESEKYKQAINSGKTLVEIGEPDLGYPFEVLVGQLKAIVTR